MQEVKSKAGPQYAPTFNSSGVASIYRSKSPSNYANLNPQFINNPQQPNFYNYSADPNYKSVYSYKGNAINYPEDYGYQKDSDYYKKGFDRYYTRKGYDMYRNLNYGKNKKGNYQYSKDTSIDKSVYRIIK